VATLDNQNVLLIANDNSLELNGLRNAITGEFVNGATVVAMLMGMHGEALMQPMPIPYVADSEGCYRVVLFVSPQGDDGLALQHDQHYKLQIAAQGNGLNAFWEAIIKAQIRRK
jgi:hypothetical protein